MKRKILLDVDGVLAKFYSGFAKFLNENYNTTLDCSHEPGEYNFDSWGNGVSKVNVEEATQRWIADGGYRKLPIYLGIPDFCAELNKTCDVHFVTARLGEFGGHFDENLINKVKSDTIDWFKDHNISAPKLFFSHKKIDFCKENGISIMIEDKLSTAIDGSKNGMDTILIDRHWNQSPQRFRVHRVFGYDEALYMLDRLLKLRGF